MHLMCALKWPGHTWNGLYRQDSTIKLVAFWPQNTFNICVCENVCVIIRIPGIKPNILFVDEKVFDEKVFEPSPKQDRLVSWDQFCKSSLKGRNFSFFVWFHEAVKLTRLHLSEQWKKGLIEGFISRDQAEKKLLTGPSAAGTFLLRFSDSNLGT